MNILKDGLCCNSACRAEEVQAHIDGLEARLFDLEGAFNEMFSNADESSPFDITIARVDYEYLVNLIPNNPAQSLANLKADAINDLNFPTMLRKMWSGSEVQDWIADQANNLRQQAKENSDDK